MRLIGRYRPRWGRRPTASTLLLAISATALGWAYLPPRASAEETCVASAPLQPSDVVGHTWSGTVVEIRQTGLDDVGFEVWSIVMAIDHVYAHRQDRDFPAGQAFSPGILFELRSSNCGSRGDMGLRVGGRYLVSTAFVTQQHGTSLGNLIAWEIHGEDANVVPGLYQTTHVSADLVSVRTVREALALLGIDASPPAPLASADASRVPAASADQTPTGWADMSLMVWVAVSVLLVVLVGTSALVHRNWRQGRDQGQ